jgi:hypothetical protein
VNTFMDVRFSKNAINFRIVFWDVLPCKINVDRRFRGTCCLRTSETSVDIYFTRQYIAEDNSELYTRHRENLKSRKKFLLPADCSGRQWIHCNRELKFLLPSLQFLNTVFAYNVNRLQDRRRVLCDELLT